MTITEVDIAARVYFSVAWKGEIGIEAGNAVEISENLYLTAAHVFLGPEFMDNSYWQYTSAGFVVNPSLIFEPGDNNPSMWSVIGGHQTTKFNPVSGYNSNMGASGRLLNDIATFNSDGIGTPTGVVLFLNPNNMSKYFDKGVNYSGYIVGSPGNDGIAPQVYFQKSDVQIGHVDTSTALFELGGLGQGPGSSGAGVWGTLGSSDFVLGTIRGGPINLTPTYVNYLTQAEYYQIFTKDNPDGSGSSGNSVRNLIVGSGSGNDLIRGSFQATSVVDSGDSNVILAGGNGDVINPGPGNDNVAFTAAENGGTDSGTTFVVAPGSETIVGGDRNDKLVILADRLWNSQTGVPTSKTLSYSSPTIQLTGGIEFGSGNNFVADFSPFMAGDNSGVGSSYYATYSESGDDTLTIGILAENRTSGLATDQTNSGYPNLWTSTITILNFHTGDFGINFVNDAPLHPAPGSDPGGTIYLANFAQAAQQFLTTPTSSNTVDDDISNQWNGIFANSGGGSPSPNVVHSEIRGNSTFNTDVEGAPNLNADLQSVESVYGGATSPISQTVDNDDGTKDITIYGILDEPFTAMDDHYDSTGALTSKLLLNADGTTYLAGTATTNSDGSIAIAYVDGSGVASGQETENVNGASEITFYGASGQSSTSIESSFDANANLTSKTISNIDGTSEALAYNITGEPYTSTDSLFNAGGGLTSETFLNADGSTYQTETVTTNPDGSTTSTFASAAGAVESENTVAADGTHETTLYGIVDEPYLAIESISDSTGTLTSKLLLNANGTTYLSGTATTNSDGSITIAYVDGSGAASGQEADNVNGASEITLYGASGQSYTSIESSFDANGNLTSKTISNIDGTSEVLAYNITSEPYTSTDSLLNAGGGLISETFVNADGSTYQTETVTTNPDGSTTSTFLDGAGTMLAQEINNSDGTFEQIAFGITGEPYTSADSHFDAGGNLTSATFLNADGSTYQTETVTTNADGSTTSTFVNAAGATVAEEIDNADGTFEQTIFGITGEPYTSTDSLFNASGNLTSATFLNANGSTYQTETVTTNADGSTTKTFVSGAGATVFQEVDDVDGTVDQTTYGVTGKPYSSYENVFDANGSLISQTLINADSSIYASETVTANGDGSTTTKYFDGSGTLTSQAIDGPSGHDETFYGVTGQSYASYENVYDANWTLVAQTLFNADGSVHENGTVEAGVDSATTTGTIAKLVSTTGSSTPDTATGAIDFVDPDLAGTNSVSVIGVTASGATGGLPSSAALTAFLSFGSVGKPSSAAPGSVAWTFAAADGTFDYLAAGQTTTLTYAVQITDAAGATVDQNVAVTVIGYSGSPPVSVADFLANQSALDGAGQFSIVDTSSNVVGALNALNDDAHVSSITLTDNGIPTLKASVGLALDDNAALRKISNPEYVLDVFDTAANVVANIGALNANSKINSITLTDADTPTLDLTVAQALGNQSVLNEITNSSYAVAIFDTAANVAANIDALNAGGQVNWITLTDSGTPRLTLTVAQALVDVTALEQITNANVIIAVSDTAANILGNADALSQDTQLNDIAVADTAANVASNFDALNADGLQTSITLTDSGTPVLRLTADQALNGTIALGEITNSDYSVVVVDTVSGISANFGTLAADAQISGIVVSDGAVNVLNALDALATMAKITGINVTDTAASVSANLDALNNDAQQLTSITLSDGGVPTLALSVSQALDDTSMLGKITNANYAVAISDTAANIAANADALATDGRVVSVTVRDTAANVLAAAPALSADGQITAVKVIDTAANVLDNAAALSDDLQITAVIVADTAANVLAHADALSDDAQITAVRVVDTAALVLDNATALNADPQITAVLVRDTAANVLAEASALSGDAQITGIAVFDTAGNVSSAFDSLNGDSQLTSISLTDSGTPTLALDVTQALGDATALGKISNGDYAVAISDSAANVSANLDALNMDGRLASITVTDSDVASLTLNASQAVSDNWALSKIANASYAVAVVDTAANVSDVFDALNADAQLGSITVTDIDTAYVTLTAAQTLDDTSAISKIVNPDYAIATIDSVANILPNVDALWADSYVGETVVSDTAATVAASLDALNMAAAEIGYITLTDAQTPTLTLNAEQVVGDTNVLSEIISTHATALVDTAANIVADGSTLSNDWWLSSATVSDTAANVLANSAALSEDWWLTSVKVVDTAANVAASIDALNADTQLSAITLTDSGTPTLDLTQAQMLGDQTALAKITNSSYAIDVVGDFEFDKGDGTVAISAISTGVLTLASDIASDDLVLQADAAGDLTIGFKDDADDSITLKNDLSAQSWGVQSAIGQITFASDGSSIGLTRWDGTLLPFTWNGTSSNTTLIGSNLGYNTFNMGSGGDTVIAGSSRDVFNADEGDGDATLENVSGGQLNLAADIAPGDVLFRTNATGALIIRFKHDAGDRILIQNDLSAQSWGVQSALQQINFASDGSVTGLTRYNNNLLPFTWCAATAGATLTGSSLGYNTFNLGAGDVTAIAASSQDVFSFHAGDGNATLENVSGGTLNLGPAIASDDVLFQTDAAGDLIIGFKDHANDSITVQNDLSVQDFGIQSQLGQIDFASDGSTLSLTGYYGALLTFTWNAASADATLTGSSLGYNTFNLGAGGDTVIAGSSQDTFNFDIGDGNVTLENVTGGTLNLGADIASDDLVYQTNTAGDLIIKFEGDADDSITVKNDLSPTGGGTISQLGQIDFASDGSSPSLTRWDSEHDLLMFTTYGTLNNKTLVGTDLGSNTFILGPGGDTVTAGHHGGAATNTYVFGSGDGQASINANTSNNSLSGTVDFTPGITSDNLWFEQTGNNLKIDVLGTTDALTIDGYFGGGFPAGAQSLATTDGLKLDTQIAQLVSAMAVYSANNSGFNPSSVTQMPTDSTLQSAVAAAWHH